MLKQTEQLVSGVYFIHAPNQSKIKIGRSVDIKKRYKQLRTGFMDEGKLLICIPSQDEVNLESILHEQFNHLRANGEWFYMTKEIDDFIINCKFDYPNVINYEDLNEIQSKLSYNSLETFNFINKIINTLKGYSLPTFSGIIGITIAYYNYKLDPMSKNGKIGIIVNYLLFLALPILNFFLWGQIIKHLSARTFKFYFIYLFVITVSGVVSFFFGFKNSFVVWIPIILLSTYWPVIKQILLTILIKQDNEEMYQNVKGQLPRTIISENDFFEVIKQQELVKKRIIKKTKIIKVTGYIFHTSAILFLNIYFLLLSKSEWVSRLIVVIIADIVITLWIGLNIVEGVTKFRRFIWLKSLKKWLIPIGVLIINWILLILKQLGLVYVFAGIIMASLIPNMLVLLLIITKNKKDKFHLLEITKLLNEFNR